MTPAIRRMRLLKPDWIWRALWRGDDGSLRCGHSGDVIQMLDDLGVPSVRMVTR